jgi:hypothetical protein
LRRAGFTVLEAVIAMTLVGLVVTKLTLVMDEARRAHREESVSMALEDQAMELIDRLAYALVGSSRERLMPELSAPFPMSEIRYQVNLGVEDGQPVWSDPEMIRLEEDAGQIQWVQNAGELNERLVVWANTVSEMLEDELMNGVDDNGNGLVNELGLAFVLDERSVTIRISLERQGEGEKTIQVTRETTVTCRN